MELSREVIKSKIADLQTIKGKLLYLDVVEKDVNDKINELYIKTRMNEIGDFLGGENGWEFVFEWRKFNPEFMLTPPLTKEQQTQYIREYSSEIKEAEDLHNLDSFIKDQKKFYEKQFVKYASMEDEIKIISEQEQNYETYDLDYEKIKIELRQYDTTEQKLKYLLFVKKEIKIVKYNLETSLLNELIKDGNKEIVITRKNELLEFIYKLNRILNTENSRELITAFKPLLESYENMIGIFPKDFIEEIENKEDRKLIIHLDTIEETIDHLKRKYTIIEKKVDEEMEYLMKDKQFENKKDMVTIKNFDDMWKTLVEEYFRPDTLREQIETIGIEKEDEYIEYCKKKFRHRTKEEWMKYFGQIVKAEEYEELDKAKLKPELDYKNRMRITEASFETCTLGQYAKENMDLFEKKYLTEKKEETIQEKIDNLKLAIRQCIFERRLAKNKLNESHSNLLLLEEKFSGSISELSGDLGERIKNQKIEIESIEKVIKKMDFKLWGNIKDAEGIIWKHDRLVREYKKEVIGDPELFSDLEEREVERWNEKIKAHILNIAAKRSLSINEDELHDIILDILKNRLSNTEQILEEIIRPEISEQNIENEIVKVLNQNYGELRLLNSSNNNENTKIPITKRAKVDGELIADEVIRCWDEDGIEEFEKIYKIVSEKSLTILGVQLTPGQIKGKYQRYSKKHKDYKREKYK